MKKIIVMWVLLVVIDFSATSQPNGGFENWTPEFTYETPDGWQTLNFLSLTSPPNPVSAFKAIGIDKHSGNYALKLKSVYLNNNVFPDTTLLDSVGFDFGDTISGVFTGLVNINPISYVYGFPYSGRPEKLEFWAKYNPVGNDTACALVFLKHSKNTGVPDTIGGGKLFIPPTPVYTLFQVPINYISDSLPDSAAIGFSPSPRIAYARQNSTLYIDDVSLTGWVGINELPQQQHVKVFPNPAKEYITINSFGEKACIISIRAVNGNLAKTFTLSENNTILNIGSLSNGLYVYEIYDSKNKMIGTGKLNIIK
jgi:hypothetical protein